MVSSSDSDPFPSSDDDGGDVVPTDPAADPTDSDPDYYSDDLSSSGGDDDDDDGGGGDGGASASAAAAAASADSDSPKTANRKTRTGKTKRKKGAPKQTPAELALRRSGRLAFTFAPPVRRGQQARMMGYGWPLSVRSRGTLVATGTDRTKGAGAPQKPNDCRPVFSSRPLPPRGVTVAEFVFSRAAGQHWKCGVAMRHTPRDAFLGRAAHVFEKAADAAAAAAGDDSLAETGSWWKPGGPAGGWLACASASQPNTEGRHFVHAVPDGLPPSVVVRLDYNASAGTLRCRTRGVRPGECSTDAKDPNFGVPLEFVLEQQREEKDGTDAAAAAAAEAEAAAARDAATECPNNADTDDADTSTDWIVDQTMSGIPCVDPYTHPSNAMYLVMGINDTDIKCRLIRLTLPTLVKSARKK